MIQQWLTLNKETEQAWDRRSVIAAIQGFNKADLILSVKLYLN